MEIHFGPTRYLEEAGQCPVCHERLDGYESVSSEATKPEDWTPDPGNLTVCLGCASVLRFEIGMRYSLATRDDLKDYQEHAPETFDMLQKMVWAANERIAQSRGERRIKGRRKRWH